MRGLDLTWEATTKQPTYPHNEYIDQRTTTDNHHTYRPPEGIQRNPTQITRET